MKHFYFFLISFFCLNLFTMYLRADDPPYVTAPVGIISAIANETNLTINLNNHFADDDSPDISYAISSNSFDTVASADITDDILTIDFLQPGQTSIMVDATAGMQTVSAEIIIGVQPEVNGDYVISDLENLALDDESYWDGSDGSGNFISGQVKFPNSYEFGIWGKWSYSNISDNTTPGYDNHFSAITGAGFDTISSGGKNYAVGFETIDWTSTFLPQPIPLKFSKNIPHEVKGLFVTNSTYTALSMENGDDFAKKFGGDTGDDPDWFKLSVWGMKSGIQTDIIEFYLADYRSNDSTEDYIVKTWQWIELSSLGEVDSLMFDLTSSDTGDFGINTPLYFAVDNIYTVPSILTLENPVADIRVTMNAPDYVVFLEDLFDNAFVTKDIISNSNPSLVTTTIRNDSLILSFAENQSGIAELIIEGTFGSQSVADTFTVTVIPPAVNGSMSLTDLLLYPNPSEGIFRVQTEWEEPLTIKIFSIRGDLVYINTDCSAFDIIDISNEPSGVYILNIERGGSRFTGRVIKN